MSLQFDIFNINILLEVKHLSFQVVKILIHDDQKLKQQDFPEIYHMTIVVILFLTLAAATMLSR